MTEEWYQGVYCSFNIAWKRSNGELPQINPSETFNMFLQGLREIKKMNEEA